MFARKGQVRVLQGKRVGLLQDVGTGDKQNDQVAKIIALNGESRHSCLSLKSLLGYFAKKPEQIVHLVLDSS